MPVPRYLLNAFESARAFNPKVPIFLIIDEVDSLPGKALAALDVVPLKIADLETPEHRRFCEVYKHVSGNSVEYERFCFSRWFYVESAMKQQGITQAMHLDSDCMLFTDFDSIVSKLGDWSLTISENSGHSAFINGSLQPLLDYIIKTFSDDGYIQNKRDIMEKSKTPAFLSDMSSLVEYVADADTAVDDATLDIGGVLDHNINAAEGYVSRRNHKKIFWSVENGMMIPYFKKKKSGKKERAFTVHFQGRQKKRMLRYNRIDIPKAMTYPLSYLGAFVNNAVPISDKKLFTN